MTVTSAGIVVLILSLWLKGRIRETGVLMAMGISRAALLSQHVTETALAAVPAFCAAWFFSTFSAGWMGSMFDLGIAAGSVTVSKGDFTAVCIAGALLILAAVFISCISVFRYKPKEILSLTE